jgi:hypothetical protein
MIGRRGRRRKQLLNEFKEKKGYRKLNVETLDRILWRTRFGRRHGPVLKQTTVCKDVGTPISAILTQK